MALSGWPAARSTSARSTSARRRDAATASSWRPTSPRISPRLPRRTPTTVVPRRQATPCAPRRTGRTTTPPLSTASSRPRAPPTSRSRSAGVRNGSRASTAAEPHPRALLASAAPALRQPRQEFPMPLYALDDARPELPASGRWWVAPGAHVMGRVRLGEDASIWFGAVLRGDNELIDIGARSNIQDGSVLHTDPGFPMVIGEDCTIGHKAILHGCVIGPGSLIGMGATILNGARIGAGCLVGAPAKAIRTMAPEQVEGLRATAAGYVRNHRRFAAGFKEVAPA